MSKINKLTKDQEKLIRKELIREQNQKLIDYFFPDSIPEETESNLTEQK